MIEQQQKPTLPIHGVMHRFFTEDDLDSCWLYYKQYLVDILNGTYKLEDAQSDLAGLIGTKWDSRNKLENEEV